METNNITIKKKPVKSLDEVNRGYAKYKTLQGRDNLLQKTTEDVLFSQGFWALSELVRRKSIHGEISSFQLKEVENKTLIEELARFAALTPEFFMTAKLLEPVLDDEGNHDSDRETLEILVHEGKVEVTIL